LRQKDVEDVEASSVPVLEADPPTESTTESTDSAERIWGHLDDETSAFAGVAAIVFVVIAVAVYLRKRPEVKGYKAVANE
jgi:hypothetical protein